MTSFGALLNRTCQVEAHTGEGRYGPTFAAAQPDVPCRVERNNELVRDRAGDEVLSTAQLFVQPDVTVTPESRVTLDDGTVTTAIAVATHDGRHAAHHLEIKLR